MRFGRRLLGSVLDRASKAKEVYISFALSVDKHRQHVKLNYRPHNTQDNDMKTSSKETTIGLRILPSFAKPDWFILASSRTGNVMAVTGKIDNDEETLFFASEEGAKKYVASLPIGLRRFVIVD